MPNHGRWRGTQSTWHSSCRGGLTSSHAFVAPLGEFCPLLEDVSMLTGLPLFDNFHMLDALDKEGESLVEELHTSMSKSKYCSNKATYLS